MTTNKNVNKRKTGINKKLNKPKSGSQSDQKTRGNPYKSRGPCIVQLNSERLDIHIILLCIYHIPIYLVGRSIPSKNN